MQITMLISTLLYISWIPFIEASFAAMSIDFGSQYLKMAIVKPGMPMEMVLNKESRRKSPNLLTIKDGERLFADAALAYSVKHPKHSFTYLVDLLGKKINNPLVSLYKQRFPHLKLMPNEARDSVQFVVDDESYPVEMLVAMILQQARTIVEDFANQTVNDVVITVPAFFNQAERRALTAAAEIAGLNLLQLMNDHSAAGLSHGIFRRKEISKDAKTLLIYDVGATKVTASILEFRLAPEKKGSNEENPLMTTIGYGFNRAVGGLEISLLLRDHLINEFRKKEKTKVDITDNPRAMAKMLKEAERVKMILSANPDHNAQVENVHEDRDFSAKVTREQLESMISGLEVSFLQPIKDALKMAEMEPEQIDQLVLMGAGTRVPRIQALLQRFFKGKEIGKFMNTDEAIAMGAVYQAAHLCKGFKVKKFNIRDLLIFPVQVDFIKPQNEGDIVNSNRIVHRPIFGYKSYIPAAKKILSFTSFTNDFSVSINYGELRHLSTRQLEEFGSVNISEIQLQGVSDAYSKEMVVEGTVYKGIKVHFNMDDSGITHVSGAEVVFEKAPHTKSTFASIAGKITGLFSLKSEADKVKGDENSDEKREESETIPGSSSENIISVMNSTNGTASQMNETAVNATQKEVKAEVMKIPLKLKEIRFDVQDCSDSEKIAAQYRLNEFIQKEREKAELEEAHHSIESLIYDLSDKLTQDDYTVFLTDEERNALLDKTAQTKTWLEEDVDTSTTLNNFMEKKKALDDLLKPINERIKEEMSRPVLVAELLTMFNHTEMFLSLTSNLTESGLLTNVEVETLNRLLSETKEWLAEKTELQKALKPVDTPAFTSFEVQEKLFAVDREVKYLLNKLKIARQKAAAEKMVEKEESDAVNKTSPNLKVDDVTEESNKDNKTEERVGEPVIVEKSGGEHENDTHKLHDDSEL